MSGRNEISWEKKPRRQHWFGWKQALLWLLGLGLLAFLFKDLDFRGISKTLRNVGPLAGFALLPYFFQLFFDSMGWFRLLKYLQTKTKWLTCFRIRVMSEAVLMSVPLGSVIGEGLKPYLLKRIDDVSWPIAIATVTTKKALLLFAMGIYILCAGLFGHAYVEGLNFMGPLEGWGVVGGLTAILFGAGFSIFMVSGGISADRLDGWFSTLNMEKTKRWISKHQHSFEASQQSFKTLHASKWVLMQSTFLLLCAWFVETLETVLLLKLVGIDLAFEQVLLMEATVVVLRNVAFFLPAGIGVQDAGYLSFLAHYGVDISVLAPSFVILKRCKELVWIVIGYLFLFRFDSDVLSRKKFLPATL